MTGGGPETGSTVLSKTDLSTTDDLITLLARARKLWPQKTAWIFDSTGQRLSFTEVDEQSTRIALALNYRQVKTGDRVAVMFRNDPEFPLLWLALAKIGAILVPININYRELDGAHVLENSDAEFILCAPEFHSLLKDITQRNLTTSATHRVLTMEELLAPTGISNSAANTSHSGVLFRAEPEKPVNIQYTSGTTGRPKGCVLSHRYWTTLARSLVEDFPSLSDADVLLTAQPFHYIDPQWNVAVGLASGATLVILDRFHPGDFWDKIREYQVTWFYCLGLMPALLLRAGPSPLDKSHRVRAISASAIPHDLHASLEERWGVPWFEAFGMTETGSDIRVSLEDHQETIGTGCIGHPNSYREAIIADPDGIPVERNQPGELLLRGIGMMQRYHKDPQATEKAFSGGWFHTGDRAKMDAKGRIYHLGRIKDIIRRSGENISADEVETALMTHPAVAIAAVIGVDDDLREQEVHAFVTLKNSAASSDSALADYLPSPDELAAFCAEKLAYFKVPRYWSYLTEMPTTPSERIAKHTLSEKVRFGITFYDHLHHRWFHPGEEHEIA